MSVSLYDDGISNKQLKSDYGHRILKYLIDYNYKRKVSRNYNTGIKIKWKTFKYSNIEAVSLPKIPGIYLFYVPYLEKSYVNHTTEFVLYIGQAQNIHQRLNQYKSYLNSDNPTDLLRRKMILFYEKNLMVKYYNCQPSELDDLEYSLIDLVLPPFNEKVRSSISKDIKKLYKL